MTDSTDLDLRSVVATVRRRAVPLIGVLILAWSATVAVILLPARQYPASITVAPVPNPKLTSMSAGLSALLGPNASAGVQSTPYFVARLFVLRSNLLGVAQQRPPFPSPTGDGPTVIERVLHRRLRNIRPQEIEPAMRDIVETLVDKQTGLVTLEVSVADSALSRFISTELLSAATSTYTAVLRAQANDQRTAVDARVDSASRTLRHAEDGLAAFASANRLYSPSSPTTIERARVERDFQNAQSVYTQAIADRDAARARELESPPAMVVVDPLPATIPPASRHLALFLGLATLGALTAGLAGMTLAGDFANVTLT